MTTFAGQWGPEALINTAGAVYVNTAFTVFLAGTSTPATLYADRTKGSTVSNPGRTTDAKGNATFFADPGSYDVSVLSVVVLPSVRVHADDADLGGAAAPLSLAAASDVVPLAVDRVLSGATKDLFQVIGQERAGPGDDSAGRYRTIVNTNGGLQTNGAILIQADIWTGANKDVPTQMAQGRGICLGIRSDVTGPTFFQASNGSADYEEFQNGVAQVVWNLKIAPSSGGSGVFLGIGDVPISTLTLSDAHDPANLTALTIRHATASARIGIGSGGTGTLDISNNFKSGENSSAEYAINLAPTGILLQTATAPAGARSEVAFFSKNTARINTTSLSINYTDGTSLLVAYEPGSGNIRFRTTDVGGGVGVMGIGNVVVAPSTTPAGGGILYVEGGALKWKGSSGTVTTVAPA